MMDPTDNIHTFGQTLAGTVAARGGPQMEYLADDESLVFEDGNLKQIVNLGNFFRMHQAGRSIESIADFIVDLGKRQGTPLDFETVRPLLHLHVVSEDFADDHGLFRPLALGLKQALVLDYPDFVRFIVQADLEQSGQLEDVLWQIAEINTDAKMPEPHVESLPGGKEALVFDCSMGAVYAWRKASTQSAAILGVPRRDLGAVVTDDQPDTVAMIAAFALEAYSVAEDHPLSPLAYLLRDGKLAGIGGALVVSPEGQAS